MKRRQLLQTASATAAAALITPLSGCGTVQWQAVAPQASSERPQALLERIYAAHGGVANWQRAQRIDATLSTGGTAFSMRGQNGKVVARRIEVYPRQFKTVIYDFPSAGSVGTWERDSVSIVPAAGGGQPQAREQARAHFESFGTGMAWDDLDLLYFVGYAIWNYLSFPFLLLDERLRVRESAVDGQPMLEVLFPPGYPTHSQQQFFMLNADGSLRRHDYVAEVFGSWASAAHFCDEAETVNGLRLYTRRHVVPAVGRTSSLSFPTLVWIELKAVTVVTQA